MISSQVYPDRRLAIHRADGDLTLAGILLAMQSLQENPAFEPDFAVVWDLRDNILLISLHEIIHLPSSIVQMANKLRPRGKVAWVPATHLGETIINSLYEEHDWSQEWRAFQSLDDALKWAEG